MTGIAEGSERDLLDIVAMNVRSEIVFGQFSDGCTSLFCRDENYTYMGQNWDVSIIMLLFRALLLTRWQWMEEQGANIVNVKIIQNGKPKINMVTEAGIIGKIGLNSCGVATCFNAIRVHGVNKNQIPCHIGLRLVLESTSAEEAVASLEKIGMASSGHFLIGDAETAIGLEFTSKTFARVPVNEDGFLVHSNHLLMVHPDTHEPKWLEDSPVRFETMTKNVLQAIQVSWATYGEFFEDESNYPVGINRAVDEDGIATLFNIKFDLRKKIAIVREGRPMKDGTGGMLYLDV